MKTRHMAIRIGVALTLMGLFMCSVMAAEEPVCDLADPVNVCMLASPDTIMLNSNCPLFGIEVEDNSDGNLTDFPVYDVQDMNDKYQVQMKLGVIVDASNGIYDAAGHLIEGEIEIVVENRKEYEISPETGRLVLQYDRNSVFDYELGFASAEPNFEEKVTVRDLLDSACSGEEAIGSVPFYIRGVFEEGVYPAGTEFYGEGNADVMYNSQSKQKGGKNK